MFRLINHKRTVILALCVAASFTLPAAVVQAAKVQIPEGTKISVRFPASLNISSGEVSEGIPLLFTLAAPIEIGGKIIVEKGAQGTAVVKECVKATWGSPGKIVLEFVDLEPKGDFATLDGSRIKLAGTVTAEGKGKPFYSYFPLLYGLFTKSGQGKIPSNQIYAASVAESIILEGP